MMGRVHIDRFTNRAIILVIATILSTSIHSHKQTHTCKYVSVCMHTQVQTDSCTKLHGCTSLLEKIFLCVLISS